MRRYWTVGLIFLLLLAVIVGRLAYLTLIEGEELQAIAEQQRTRSLDYYQYARGDFYDALGRPLTSHEESCLVVFPAMIADPEQTAAALAELLAMDEDLLCRRLTDENNRSIEPYVFKTGLSAEQTAAIESGQIRGVLALPLAARYRSDHTASHLLGTVTEKDGEYHGASGLEYQYDDYLSGRQDQQVTAFVDAEGNLSAEQFYVTDPQQLRCNNVQLTINLDYQQIAEQALGDQAGACVILDPDNGDILAAVSSPSYDPYSWEPLPADDVYVNKAFSAYPPASTFKVVLAAAAWENNLSPLPEDGGSADASSAAAEFICDGAYSLAEGYDVGCWLDEGHGQLDLASALAESCNCYFVGLGLAMGGEMIIDYAARFGLDGQSIIGYEFADSSYLDFSAEIAGDIANVSIGESGVRITPLQSAVMMAVCANGGYLLTPRLVQCVYDQDRHILEEFPSADKQRTIAVETAAALREMLTLTVSSGTGVAAAGSATDSAGKTGTSEDAGVWFSGFAPAAEPRWVVSVYLSDGSSSAEAAAVFSKIIDAIAILEGVSSD